MEQEVILVDENDNIIGRGEKMDIHRRGLLHRAFSIFLYNKVDKTILIQKRSMEKYHSGGLWSNACCSHQYKDELWKAALKRCILDELGFQACIKYCYEFDPATPFFMHEIFDPETTIQAGAFTYFSNYGEITEHEIDHVIVYCPDKTTIEKIKFTPDEISEIQWISVNELNRWLQEKPTDFTSWFKEAYEIAKSVIKEQ